MEIEYLPEKYQPNIIVDTAHKCPACEKFVGVFCLLDADWCSKCRARINDCGPTKEEYHLEGSIWVP